MRQGWTAFNALCRLLATGLLDGDGPKAASDSPGEELIRVSSQHLATPSLAWCLRGTTAYPDDIRAYFDAVLHLNDRRNALLLSGLTRIVAILNARGIEPMLLKGAALLVGGVYPTPAARLMGDLDLLIEATDLRFAAHALTGAGFATRPDDPLEADHHHLPMLYEERTGIGVELHGGLAPASYDRIVPADWFWQDARSIPIGDGRAVLPDPTRMLAHAIVHDQLVHHQYRWHGVELRQLLDVALLRKRHAEAIDWDLLRGRFEDRGFGRVLSTSLAFGQVLLGQAMPPVRFPPKRNFLRKFEHRSDRWPTLCRLAGDYLHARRTSPAGVLNLVRSGTWRRRVERIKASFSLEV